MSNKNNFTGQRLEFHILQSFPVSCLNRDDMGAPKSVKIGGVNRARVSSQCWKRAVRMQMHELGYSIAKRTKYVARIIEQECLVRGAKKEQAEICSEFVAQLFAKTENKRSDTLFFIASSEVRGIVDYFEKCNFEEIVKKINEDLEQKKQSKKESKSTPLEKEIKKELKKCFNVVQDCVDIALFGRMIAKAVDMNVEAAASFAHAISIHEVNPEIDFFTAVDEYSNGDEELGSAHMGTLEYNSATYYRYVSLDLGQLAQTMGTEEIEKAIRVFVSALFLAVPSARQATMAAATPWDFAIVTLRKGQNIQIPFTKPIEGKNIVEDGIDELRKRFEDIKQLYGVTLFGEKFVTEVMAGNKEKTFDNMLNKIIENIKA